MNQENLRQQTYDLLDLAEVLGPEGEDIDLIDLDLALKDIVGMSNLLGRLRTAGEVVKRSLAQAWEADYEGEAYVDDTQAYYLGYATKRTFLPGQEIAFAEWLKDQPIDVIRDVIAVSSIRVTPLGRPGSPLRDTFFDEVVTSKELRIMTRPAR
jgi:hypothetical protein